MTNTSSAIAVMERSEHVLLVAAGAEAFAQACGLELVDPAFFLDTSKTGTTATRAPA